MYKILYLFNTEPLTEDYEENLSRRGEERQAKAGSDTCVMHFRDVAKEELQ